MLTVTIKNGDENSKEFWVNDLGDLKIVQGAITDEFQKVLAQDKSEEKIELERVLDASPCDNADDLIDWLKDVADICDGDLDIIKELAEMKDELDSSDYESIEDMLDQLERMGSVLSDVYYAVRDFN